MKKRIIYHPTLTVAENVDWIDIALNGDFGKFADAGANMTRYAWFVWEKGFVGQTELHWIENLKG